MLDNHYKLLRGIAGVRCQECQEFIWTRLPSQSRTCQCGNTRVSGGRNEVRYEAMVGVPAYEVYDVLVNLETEFETLLPTENGVT